MVFVKLVRSYRVSLKFVKSLGAGVLSLGFPLSEVEKGNLSLAGVSEKIRAKGIEEDGGNIVFLLLSGADLQSVPIKVLIQQANFPYFM